MVNVCDVVHWFRDATSDRRLETLCRLLDCCMPLELQFLNTYLDEVLGRNLVVSQHSDSNVPELNEITDSTCRRQLCLILTRIKTANVLAGCIYNKLIQYNFSEFFSRVMVMEEELVDEILLLFTLAANHPAMSFSQRRNLHQRLTDLRETIDKSFKCFHASNICQQHNQEYVCKPLQKPSTRESTNSNEHKQPMAESTKTEANMQQPPENAHKTTAATGKSTSQVHIKDLRVVRVQQRSFDKKYEYIFEVTWSNGKMVRIHRAYGELFDFQCKLRRRYTKEVNKMTERKVIPYLPARRPIKFCKGNQILPDITDYVREFTKLPDKLLHSESVEQFFSDGTEKNLDEKHQNFKTKQSSNNDKKDHSNATCKHVDASRVHVDVKSEKGTGSIKNHSPKGKSSNSFSGKRVNNSLQTSGKLESKKRASLSPKINANDTPVKSKVGNKSNVQHQPKTILRPTHPSSPKSSKLEKTVKEEIRTDSSSSTENIACTEKTALQKTLTNDTQLQTTNTNTDNSDTMTTEIDVRTNESIIEDEKDSALSTQALTSHSKEPSILIPSSTDLPVSSTTEVTSAVQETSTITAVPEMSSTPSDLSITTSSIDTSSEFSPLQTFTDFSSASDANSLPSSSAPSNLTTPDASALAVTSADLLAIPTSPSMSSSESASLALTSSVAIPPTSSWVISTASNMTQITPSTITSPVSNVVTSLTKPIMTSFSVSSALSVTSPQTPLTVAVPLLSPPCITCSISNQSSSEGSVASSLSRTPLTSPAVLRIAEDVISHESTAEMKFSFDRQTFNGSTCSMCKSSESKLCQCDKLEHDFAQEQVLDLCGDDTEAMKLKTLTEEQRLKSAIDNARSGKNGYSRHHHTTSQHGLLTVSNGYTYPTASDLSLQHNNYDCQTAEQNNEELFYGLTSHHVKTDDSNDCSYIYQNGDLDPALDFNSNTAYEYKYTPYLNGFSKPFCYNCGGYGHHGTQCSETEFEDYISQ